MGCTLLPYRASGQQGLEPKMLTIAEYNADTHSFYARLLNADASSGEIVIPGHATDNEIREFANENLCAPQCGDFSSAPVEWESA